LTVLSALALAERLRTGDLIAEGVGIDDLGPASLPLHLGSLLLVMTPDGPLRTDVPEDYSALCCVEPDPDGYLDLEPGATALSPTRERFSIPLDLCGFMSGSSDLARLGIAAVLSTFVSPGYSLQRPGVLTLELTNMSRRTVRLRPAMRIGHLILMKLDAAAPRGHDSLGGGYGNSLEAEGSSLHRRLYSARDSSD